MKFDAEICKGVRCHECSFNRWKDGCLLAKRLDEIEIIPEPHWIPCSERLPIIDNNNRARVLITTSWGFVKEAYYCVDHWEINDIDFILTSVIAWMPLPKPYKDGEQNETD